MNRRNFIWMVTPLLTVFAGLTVTPVLQKKLRKFADVGPCEVFWVNGLPYVTFEFPNQYNFVLDIRYGGSRYFPPETVIDDKV